MSKYHPLVYAVLELRIPFSPRLVSSEALGELASKMHELPVVRQEQRPQATASPGVNVTITSTAAWRFLDRESTRSFLVASNALVYETTRYPGFDAFVRDVTECLNAVSAVAEPVGYDRLGLRYINEVRRENTDRRFEEWRQLIAPDLVDAFTTVERAIGANCAVSAEDPCRLETADTTQVFALPENTALTIRMANLEGPGVIGNDPLRRWQLPDPGPFYVVDFDGFWPREPNDIRAFRVSDIVELMERVHRPVKAAFQWATTPEYRNLAGVINE